MNSSTNFVDSFGAILAEVSGVINGYVWSPALVFLCLGAGLYFSIRTRFMQVRGIKEMIRLMFNNKASTSGVSSFQALAMSLSGRVGVGNIAGVAAAIAAGGPGAVFWMWVVAFLGASTSYIECTLAQIYKEKDSGNQYRGGPAYYIEKAMGQKWYAYLFAIFTVLATGFLLPAVQSNNIAAGLNTAWAIEPIHTAIGLAVFLAFIIIGGLKRIAKFAEIIVPFMALGYILTAIIVLAFNAGQIPAMFKVIITSAFGFDAAFGAVIGSAIMMGVKRGIYSNEAGQGTGPHAAAAAEVNHPAEQGYVQAFSIYVDTLMVCTATAFMILITGMYNVESVGVINVAGAQSSQFASLAIETVLPGFGKGFVALALFLFAFTTIIAYYYMAETNLAYLQKNKLSPIATWILRLGIIAVTIIGCVYASDTAWNLGDIGVGIMAWANVIAILIIQKPALAALRDYEKQRKAGKTPRFDPDSLGIKNADIWKEINAKNAAKE